MLNGFKSIMLPMADKHDNKALRHFAWQMSVAFPLIFAGLLPWIFDDPMPIWPFILSGTLVVSALILPILLFPLYTVWIVFASVLGWTNTQIILALAYFALILPIGLLLRLLGKLGYTKKIDKSSSSYWIDRETPPNPENLKEPF